LSARAARFAAAAAAIALALCAAAPCRAAAADPLPARDVRGPLECRDEFLLAQSLLSLPATGAALVPPGHTEVRLDFDWGNDFGIEADAGGRPADLLFFVDGEHRTAAATVRRGLRGGWAAGIRVPVHWRGGGWLDGVIDPFHDLFGFPDSGRPLYARRRLRVEGRTPERVAIEWEGRAGTGLGSIEFEIAKALRASAGDGTSIALVARAALPTTGGTFAGGGGGIGMQAVASQPLGGGFDLHAGGGGTFLGPRRRDGIDYARSRAHGFAALEWRFARAWSALMQFEASSRLVTGIDRYPPLQLSLRLGSKVDLGPRWRIEGGFVEGIKDLDNTVDFGVFLAFRRRI
jgi:hypothetical protein